MFFGEIKNDLTVLNDSGQIVEDTWNDLPNHNENIRLGSFIIMPNHIHGIIEIVGADSKSAQLNKSANSIVHDFHKENNLIETIREDKRAD